MCEKIRYVITFQEALGRTLALSRSTTLKLDVTDYETCKIHAYALRHFSVIESFATRDEIRRLRGGGWMAKQPSRRLHRLIPFRKDGYILEKGFAFDPEVLESPDDVYLEGYWQSERYFTSIEGLLRRELTIRHSLSGRNREMAARIAGCNAVSLHVRRGDYVSNPDSSRVHGLCGMDYHQTAVRRIAEVSPQPHLFVFSDEPEWAARNLHLDHPMTIVTGNDTRHDYEDLHLMSLCRHHVIANSSFSWWGAWLGANPDKIVIAPARWFASGKLDTRDLFPPSWTTV